MKLAISGTYSAGKTSTVIGLSHYTGLPRTLAKTIREIMPEAVPGKSLAQVAPAEFLQLAMRRHNGRAVEEALLGDNFLSDGSSLQEWIYGAGRVRYGMNPTEKLDGKIVPRAELSAEMLFFEDVVGQYGHAFRQHVKATFDAYIHLRNEHPVSDDGHRPMNEGFRTFCDDMLLATLDELEIPHHIVAGTLPERLDAIVGLFGLPTVMSLDDAITRTDDDYAAIDWRLETERASAASA